MNFLIFLFFFTGIAIGVGILWYGIRKQDKKPKEKKIFDAESSQLVKYYKKLSALRNFWVYVIFGAIGGVVVGLLTGWPVMGICIFISTIGGFWLFGSKAVRDAHIAKTQAIATWTEMIRDTIAGAAGLEEALIATGHLAPAPIAPEIRKFLNYLEYQSLDEALTHLGEILEHPSADLVVVSLANAARTQAENLSDVLTRLAVSIRGDVTMRVRVEVGRAKIITSSKIVVTVSALTILYLIFFAQGILEPYGTIGGQLWLLVVFGVFWVGGWLLHFYGQIELPERFLSRKKATYEEEL